ncbi:hypothetical protein AGOR_G00221090 [Albula goreensis]|uniref:TNRC6 PABC binding domain-containing protein n=1 Tax=Albula goreensis TaxID=1534307 RepID=A0A8T3CLB4_9TELE|nr:hypothetical protein AGOR_G00221090 [Albula goreensis]
MDGDRPMMNMGEFNSMAGKASSLRHHIPKESSADRAPYFDKNVGAMFGGGSAGAGQGRGSQQPPGPPLNSSQPTLRPQVPPPLFSSQVPPSMLKYPLNNGAMGPLLNPQQVAVLSQLSQLNQISQITQLQRLLLQQQKLQTQRNMAAGVRQQQELQGRTLGSSQQVMPPPPSRHLDPSLMKPQTPPQPPPSLHQPGLKSYLENYMPQNAPDLQKGPNALGSFSNFPLGLNSNLNVNSLDISGVGFKEPQSRLNKWIAMDISGNSPLDQNSGKPGVLSSGLRLEDSLFSPHDFMGSGPAPVSPQAPWVTAGPSVPNRLTAPAMSPGHQVSTLSPSCTWKHRLAAVLMGQETHFHYHNGSNDSSHHFPVIVSPSEFRPGEPWEGYPNIDPETDPYVTPGSVINNLSINTVRDRNNGTTSSLNTTLPSNSAWSSMRASNYPSALGGSAPGPSARSGDSKSSWSPGTVPSTSLAHELWKVPLPPQKAAPGPSRPPPGLTSQKQPSSWDSAPLRLGGWGTSDSRYTPGSSWGDSSSGRTTNWLVLKNLTPQIDGSTLRTLCMQHGPLITFHLNLPHGNAVVCYSSREEAAKAQKSLHMCVLGNTTILAEFASEEEISRFFAQGQSMAPAPTATSPSWQGLGTGQNRIGTIEGSHSFPSRTDPNPPHWSGGGDLHGGSSLWPTPTYPTSLWGSPGGGEGRGISSPSPINSFLPVDHLTGGGDTM